MELGRLGVFAFTDGFSAGQSADFARRIEALGYSAMWVPEAVGREPFSQCAWLLANTRRLIVATGIANIYARDPVSTGQAQQTLAELSGGRFLLGLGVSHQVFVEGRGHAYQSPVQTMSTYLDSMKLAPYLAARPAEEPPTVIAALGPKMLALAKEKTQGAHPYLVPPEHTAQAREILGPDRWLCTEQKVILTNDPTQARTCARKSLAIYLGLPNYQRNLKRLGLLDSDFENGGSDKLIDTLVAWGDEKAIADRIQAHFDAGASHVCIQALNPEGGLVPDERILEALAPST